MNSEEQKLRLHSKIYVFTIIIGLAISGLTAFPLETEIAYLVKHNEILPINLQIWLGAVYQAIKNTNLHYPFLSYGTDWLAFTHIMLAILFIGPLKDPVKNKWIINFGMLCCIAIIPLALIAGNIRQIPVFWQLIDCSFGIIGIIPLILCRINIKKIEILEEHYGLWTL
ncbi:hypothetical protein EZ456_23975 [Pedobacter psychrodurus]|uniref:Uncharacterized protein n=1 Tax=Pedobacter psychrodurus TaxID=2530456 RepID=A0A4R0PG15_9SPHI|nr:hypothetical protein [Pedobacter psychrodurus]TCD16873.1 hypothetical protein EZ456_23975 [Pedobacter psychrodurus]